MLGIIRKTTQAERRIRMCKHKHNKNDKLSKNLLNACGRGSDCACNIVKRLKKVNVLFAGSVVAFSDVIATDDDHPNKLPFKGVLLILDEPSDKAPHGSEMHRIFVSTKVAKNKLSGLVGMGVNYSSDLTAHATTHKVGIITKSWIEDNKLWVSGFIWERDFPEASRLKGRSDLGMSMELTNVFVEDDKALVWKLDDFEFTGATILKKDAAAYTKTSLAARAANLSLAAKAATGEERNQMRKGKEQKRVAASGRGDRDSLLIQAMGGQLTTALQNVLGPMVQEQKNSNQMLADSVNELGGRLRLLEVKASAEDNEDEDDDVVLHAAKEDDDDDDMAAGKSDEDDDDDDDDMAAAKGEEDDDDDDDDMAAARTKGKSEEDDDDDDGDDDSDDLDAMEDLSLEDASQDPGEVNKDASNRGSKTTVTKPPKQKEHFSGNVAKGRLKGKGMKKVKKPFSGMDAAAVTVERLYASNSNLKRSVRTLQAANSELVAKVKDSKRHMRKIEAQMERFAEEESRRSRVPNELIRIASKSNIDLGDIKASGQKLSVESVDNMFANAMAKGLLMEPKDRIHFKMMLEEQGLMDQGAIDRGFNRLN